MVSGVYDSSYNRPADVRLDFDFFFLIMFETSFGLGREKFKGFSQLGVDP